EIPSTEICAFFLLRFPGTPVEAQTSIARQAREEARHAKAIYKLLKDEGGHLGEYPTTCELWNHVRNVKTLSAGVAIEQVVEEGFGLGHDYFLADLYAKLGRSDLAEFQTWIQADEINHAR